MKAALVIGLDGMDLAMLQHLTSRGVMTFTQRLLVEGDLASLRAPVPEISATSWASFLTGANPGRHGIFGFVDLFASSYRAYFPNLDHLRAPPLWEYARAAGLRTLCLNVPTTYPARAIDGVIVSGFVAPDLGRAISPPRLRTPLESLAYELDVEVEGAEHDPPLLLSRLHRCLDARARVFEMLLRDEPWQLAIATITETDRLQHFLWADLVDHDSIHHHAVLDFYRHVDKVIEGLVRSVDDDVAVFLVSDHGFCRIRTTLYINTWLRQHGYLALAVDAPTLDAIDQRTVAFALDPARIYLHRRGRFPRGSLSDSAASSLAGELREALRQWRAPGTERPVFAEVLTAHEAYGENYAQHAPDLVCVPNPGHFVRGSHRHAALEGNDVYTGMHTRDNAIFYARSARFQEPVVDMTDVLPTVLASMGCDVTSFEGSNVIHSR